MHKICLNISLFHLYICYMANQNTANYFRYGQTKPVFAYRLMAHGTMEEKIYKRQVMANHYNYLISCSMWILFWRGWFNQVTKESLAARVVDRQQVHRTISKEEMLHLFDFGDDENSDTLPEVGQENKHVTIPNTYTDDDNCPKKTLSLPHRSFSADKLMESLLSSHHPR